MNLQTANLIFPLIFFAFPALADVYVDFETPGDIDTYFTRSFASPGAPLVQTHFIPHPELALRGLTPVYPEDTSNTYVQSTVNDHFLTQGALTTKDTFVGNVTVSMDIATTFRGDFAITLKGLDGIVESAILHVGDMFGETDSVIFYGEGLLGHGKTDFDSAANGTERASEFDLVPPSFYRWTVGLHYNGDGSSVMASTIAGVQVLSYFAPSETINGEFNVIIAPVDGNTQAGGSYLDNFSVQSVPEPAVAGYLFAAFGLGLLFCKARSRRRNN